MITPSNLAEQLREYQIRSKHEWASAAFFSSTSNIPSREGSSLDLALSAQILTITSTMMIVPWVLHEDNSILGNICPVVRVDVISIIWELLILAFLVLSAVFLYFRHMRLPFFLICVTTVFLVCMRITKQV